MTRPGMLACWQACALICLLLHSGALALDLTCFSNSGAVLATPQSLSWNADRAVFNEKIDSQPAAVAYAHSQAEVQDIVRCAQASGLKAVPRGGGHGYEGYAVQAGAVVVDVTNLTSFSVDATKTSVTFGAGFRLGELLISMSEQADSLYPAGTCPWVGTSGHVLGGGTGMSSRSYGLACDQLLSVTMVDYKGDIIEANSNENADLLWASCGGGGGNLGIVTSFTVKTNPLSAVPAVTTATLSWSGYTAAPQVFDTAQEFFPTADTRMNGQLAIGFGQVSINVQWHGDQQSCMQQLQQSGLLGIAGMEMDMTQATWMDAALRWGAASMSISNDSVYNLNMTTLPAAAEKYFTAGSSYNQEVMSMDGIHAMVQAVAGLPSNEMAFVEHKFIGGAVSDVKPSETAFAYRSSLYESQWFYFWTQGDFSEKGREWLASTTAAMQPYVGQGAYINYPDPLLAASPQWPETYYGSNLERYIDVKTKYDPGNFFSNPLTVKPRNLASSPGYTAPASQQISSTVPPTAGFATAGRKLLFE